MASASGPVEMNGIRSVIAEVPATLPTDAVEVEVHESRRRVQSYPGRPDLDLDCLQLQIVPSAAGALDVTIDVFEQYGGVNVFVGAEDAPVEVTAPININEEPPRPFLDVIREVVNEVAAGEFDAGTWPGGDFVAVSHWSEEGRTTYGVPDDEGINWTPGSPWS